MRFPPIPEHTPRPTSILEIEFPESWKWYVDYKGRPGATDPDTGAKMTGLYGREFFGSKSLAKKRYDRLVKAGVTQDVTLFSIFPAEGGFAGSKWIEGHTAGGRADNPPTDEKAGKKIKAKLLR